MDDSRTASISRKTRETEIELNFSIDGSGNYSINTGIPFFNHVFEIFARHGRFDLDLHAEGDIEVDFHHLVEDTGICLGNAFKEAIGEKKGIKRFSYCYAPLDDALVRVCIDVSGRAYLCYNVHLKSPTIVHFDAGLIEDFLRAFVHNAYVTVHVDCIRGKNTHHIVEALFKALGIALREASDVIYPEDEVPSTKGML